MWNERDSRSRIPTNIFFCAQREREESISRNVSIIFPRQRPRANASTPMFVEGCNSRLCYEGREWGKSGYPRLYLRKSIQFGTRLAFREQHVPQFVAQSTRERCLDFILDSHARTLPISIFSSFTRSICCICRRKIGSSIHVKLASIFVQFCWVCCARGGRQSRWSIEEIRFSWKGFNFDLMQE